MKIFLTGEPHSGKSTLINKILSHFDDKIGFVTNEVLENGERKGFELTSSIGVKAMFASTEYTSAIRVSKYGIEISILDKFLEGLPLINQSALLYIDEVGQMQLHSDTFSKIVDDYISAPNNFIGTLSKVYDHELIQKLRQNSEIEVIEVTPENRDVLENVISSKLIH
ncbi:MAG: nucleoside-triphosphatase [Candidatus Microsaccharimonas sp.]